MKRAFVYCGTWEASALPGAKNDAGKGEGIYAFELDTSSGVLIPVNLAYAKDAGVLAVSPDQKYLYGANESRDFGGIPASGGGVTAFSIDQKTGGVSRINDSIAYGACTAYVSVSKSGRYLLAANHGSHFDLACRYVPDGHGGWKLERVFDDASLAVFRLREDGGIDCLTDLKQFSGHGYYIGNGQSVSHIHSVSIREDNLVIGCNRGADRLEIFRLNEDTGKLELLASHHYERQGLAPRHLVFHPVLDVFYVCNENYPCVTVWSFDDKSKEAIELQLIGTLPPEEMEKNPIPELHEGLQSEEEIRSFIWYRNSPADIHIHPNGRFLYVSNRNPGSIAVFEIEETNGLLTYVENYILDDDNPRGFEISPDGHFAVIGLMGSGRTGVYTVDERSGRILEKVYETIVPNCCSIRFAELTS